MVLTLVGKLRNRCPSKEQSLLFEMFKTFDYFESSHKSDFFPPIRPIFLHGCATHSELPSNISTMILPNPHIK